MLRDSLSAAGGDVSALAAVAEPTGCALILVTPDGENSIVVAPGANGSLTRDFLAGCEEAWAGAEVVVVQLEIPMASVEHVAAVCRRRGRRLLLNAAPAAALDEAVLATCDPLVVNESEALILLGEPPETGSPPESLARRLLARGPRSVVLTLAAAGALGVSADGAVHHEPGRRVDAVDTTGAGDAFVGALATALAAGHPLAEGLVLASDVAAFSVQQAGAQPSYPVAAEL